MPILEISEKIIVGIAPESLTGLAIVLSIMSKVGSSWLLVCPVFCQIPIVEKRCSHQDTIILVGTIVILEGPHYFL